MERTHLLKLLRSISPVIGLHLYRSYLAIITLRSSFAMEEGTPPRQPSRRNENQRERRKTASGNTNASYPLTFTGIHIV